MANPEHIEWLLEGVDAWNARREKDDFVPDFEGADLYKIFSESGNLTGSKHIDLTGVNFTKADLRKTNIQGAFSTVPMWKRPT